jgi:hypothetical protein
LRGTDVVSTFKVMVVSFGGREWEQGNITGHGRIVRVVAVLRAATAKVAQQLIFLMRRQALP